MKTTVICSSGDSIYSASEKHLLDSDFIETLMNLKPEKFT
jgi:hypothetical protein